jgi:signal peptidase I
MTDPSPRRSRRRTVLGSPWFHLVAAFVVFGLVLTFIAKPYVVPSESMEPALMPGDRILVSRIAYLGSSPSTGDVVVFDADEAWDGERVVSTDPFRSALRWIGEVSGFGPSGAHTLVKRVIGEPGQTVACCTADGALTVDGVALDEPYVMNDLPFDRGSLDCTTEPRSTRCFDAVVVPADSYLMLGDNRAASSDSAAFCRSPDAVASCWRWASRDGIVGRAEVILWPIARWNGV